MSVSLRNQRAEIYEEFATNDGGYLSQTPTSTGRVYWCRLLQVAGRESTLAGGPVHSTAATVEFGDEAVIPEHGVIVVDSVAYAIRGQSRRPMLRVLMVDVEALPASPLTLAPDPVFTDSGADEVFHE